MDKKKHDESETDNRHDPLISEPAETLMPDEPGETRLFPEETSEGRTLTMSEPETTRPLPVPEPEPSVSFVTTEWYPGMTLLEDYAIEKLLGEGGMGSVFLVRRKWDNQYFAVKTLLSSLLSNPSSKRAFLRELRTWIDLPEHPHLTACRFFKTIEDRFAIFSEYVSGGSLQDWIRRQQLTTLDRILDAAIQFAWGLHAAHVCGVVHQDVKPSNALLTEDGIVKVTDFGLSRARHAGDIPPADIRNKSPETSILVSSGGMTPAYCSPEQAAGEKLSRKTDIWSWGVSILEMFAGCVQWRFGVVAPLVLERMLKEKPVPPFPALPKDVAHVLERCFAKKPGDRWENLLVAAEALMEIYQSVTGDVYPRPVPDFPEPERVEQLDRTTTTFTGWQDPLKYMKRIYELEGKDPAEAERLVPVFEGSRKAQALIDLELYSDIETMLRKLIADQPDNLEAYQLLISSYLDRPWIHQVINDIPGMLHAFDQAMELSRELAQQHDDEYITDGIATAAINKATALSSLNKKDEALTYYQIAEDVWTEMAKKSDNYAWRYSLGLVHFNRGELYAQLGKHEDAIVDFNACREIFEFFMEDDPSFPRSEVSLTYNSLARSLFELNRLPEAGRFARKAVDICRRVPEEAKHDTHIRRQLAVALLTYGEYFSRTGKNEDALAHTLEGCRIFEHFVKDEGRSDMREYLAMAYHKLANISGQSLVERARYYDRAIRIYTQLINFEDQKELMARLASARLDRADFYMKNGNLQNARTDVMEITQLFETDSLTLDEFSRRQILDRLRELAPVLTQSASDGESYHESDTDHH